MITFQFNHPDYADQQLNKCIYDILEMNKLMSMATVDDKQKAHINTAYFAYNNQLHLYLITDPSSQHSKNVENNDSVALTIFNSHQEFWTELQGLQLFGRCMKTPILQVPNAFGCFLKRFPVFKEFVNNPKDMLKKSAEVRFYTIEVARIKLFDEPNFGEENYINLTVQ